MTSSKVIFRTSLLIGGSYALYNYQSQKVNNFSWNSTALSRFFQPEDIFADSKSEKRTEGNREEKTTASDSGNLDARDDGDVSQESEAEKILSQFGRIDPSLPTYTLDDVMKHSSKETGIWVTFRNGVYDITSFVDVHPGGFDKIRLAFGGAIDPFWEIYGQHKVEHVLMLLEGHRIGNLSNEDAEFVRKNIGDDIYANDPKRHPALIERSKKPYNAETPHDFLGGDSFYTPNQMFYVRNHLGVPVIDPSDYKLRVTGKGLKTTEFTLQELESLFPKKKIVSTVQCAGNRRDEMNRNTDKKVSGLVWDIGAIGNAEWAGAPLRDILEYCGFENSEEVHVEHVWFEGLDVGADNTVYGASIPIDKALDERGDVILAYEMNGQPIPRDHGYPVRAICPGIVGARSVKWVGTIVTSEEESHSHWQRKDYKGFGPNVPLEKIDWDSAPSIQELPVQSAISYPKDGQKIDRLKQDELKITGYAYSGGGRDIIRVDISLDGGKTWDQAILKEKPIKEKRAQSWSWRLWEYPLEITDDLEELDIVVKAVDSSYNVQPESSAPIWNARGVLSNSWHRIRATLEDSSDDSESENESI